MTEYQSVLEDVWFDRLQARVTKATVFQHVPDNTPPPVVILGDISFDNQGTKDGPLYLFNIVIVSVIRGHGRKALDELQAEVEAAVKDWTPDAQRGVGFGEAVIQSGNGRLIDTEDGSPIYYGEMTFTQFVFPA